MTAVSIWLIAAALAQALLALLLLAWLGHVRLPLVSSGNIRVKDIALSKTAWPERAQQAANAVDNQFQLPVLLYAGTGLALWFGPTPVEAILACVFVASRYVHAAIHITTNHVTHRFVAYVVGYAALCLFWLALVVRLVIEGTA